VPSTVKSTLRPERKKSQNFSARAASGAGEFNFVARRTDRYRHSVRGDFSDLRKNRQDRLNEAE